jgi:hypothetical protein
MPCEIFQLVLEKGLARKFPKNDLNQVHDRGLPAEILDMVRQEEGVLPKDLMTVEEAAQHRLELMDVRSRFHDTSEDDWQSVQYSFCEH